MKKYQLLKTIVGSQAHGLAESGSDTDYRGVYNEEIPHYGRFSFKVINPEFLLKHGE